MAVVLPPDDGAKALSASGLRRSHSASKFGTQSTGSFRPSVSASKIQDIYQHDLRVVSDSETSSAPSSPSNLHSEPISICAPVKRDLSDHFNPSTEFALPCYDGPAYFSQAEDLEPPPSPGGLGDSYTVSPNDNNTSVGTSRPDSPTLIERADDDTAIRAQPSRHVDYLSHDWKEEDIWESWKYIVSKRGEYQNSARLENASWRTWMKAKNNLKTITPETLNWLKDCDVTWLYGPLQTGNDNILPPRTVDSVELTKSNSFLNNKKPILKKRSMSELMLQRSLSTSSLVKQAAAAVQAQQLHGIRRPSRPTLGRANTDVATYPFSSQLISPKNSLTQSTNSSSLNSPSVERKHIHFNEQVQQCIAVDVKGDDDDDDSSYRYQNDSDSDDGGIMMKRSFSKKKRPILKRRTSSSKPESKTIAMLPATQLKYRADTPEPPERSTAMKHSYKSPAISPSSSQETLRPSKASRKFVFADDSDSDEDEDEDESEPQPTSSSGGLKQTSSSGGLAESGMRRTASGMLMPYDEGEPATENSGLVGRVLDTVNTARDIAHVIWNVGWRK